MSELCDLNEIFGRRFGSLHDLPCDDPNVLTCAMFGCQKAGRCQKGNLTGTGSQIVLAATRPGGRT